MKRLSVGTADVLLENYELGQGKIIISDLDFGSWSYYWGSMGSNLEDFLKDINKDYFASKLCNNREVFSGKKTAKEVRRFIKEDLNYDLPWYKFMSAQKELRGRIKELEYADSHDEAIHIIANFHNDLMCYELDKHDEKEFLEILEDNFSSEPWHFLQTEPSREYNYLTKLHGNIIKALKPHNTN